MPISTNVPPGKYSSRSKFGSVQDNFNFVRSQFVKFNVNDHITITIGGCDDLLRSHRIASVNILILDADGRIDRDLAALYDRLSPGCKIIIDDVDDNHLRDGDRHRSEAPN